MGMIHVMSMLFDFNFQFSIRFHFRHTSPRLAFILLARWIEVLQTYDFVIEHLAGQKDGNADALSRRPCTSDCKFSVHQETREAENQQSLNTRVMEVNQTQPQDCGEMTYQAKVRVDHENPRPGSKGAEAVVQQGGEGEGRKRCGQ